MAVLPAAQGRGIGAQLPALAEDPAHSLCPPEVRLYTNEATTGNLAHHPPHRYTETHRAQQYGYHRVYFRERLGS